MSYTYATTNSTKNNSIGKDHQPLEALQQDMARANLFHILSRAFSSPLEMEDETPEMLRSLVCDLPDSLRNCVEILVRTWEPALDSRETLLRAYARLFLGPFEILATPYASFYLENNQRVMGEVSQWVSDFYARAGLGPGTCPREVPDHIALELEFLYYLDHQYITTGSEFWCKQHEVFMADHIRLWVPLFIETVLHTEEHDFYSAACEVLKILLSDTGNSE